jgi:hypothetical protein
VLREGGKESVCCDCWLINNTIKVIGSKLRLLSALPACLLVFPSVSVRFYHDHFIITGIDSGVSTVDKLLGTVPEDIERKVFEFLRNTN